MYTIFYRLDKIVRVHFHSFIKIIFRHLSVNEMNVDDLSMFLPRTFSLIYEQSIIEMNRFHYERADVYWRFLNKIVPYYSSSMSIRCSE